MVFITLMLIIFLSWRTAQTEIRTQRTNTVDENATFIENTLKQRFSIYENTLRSASGLFTSSNDVTRSEWRAFVRTLKLPERYPGIRGVGFIKVVPAHEKDAFVASVQATDLPNYTIIPAGERAVFAPVLYIVPTGGTETYNDTNSPIIGFDTYTDHVRQEAMDKAAKSGEPVFSSVANLVPQALSQTSDAEGFILFMPLYKKDMPVTTEAERLQALDGFFYAPFLTNGIFANVFTIKHPNFGFTIYDQQKSNHAALYESTADLQSPAFTEAKRSVISLYGQDWTIVYKTTRDILPRSIRIRPYSVVIGGSIFSAALALVIYLLIQRRTRALAYIEQKRLEEAKDDLLSLASHQLRTPATAVKQYISMVRDGFAGKLSHEQRELLRMAYESNERQLTIVDDLLYVARIDAGQAVLRIERVYLIDLLSSIINDQKATIAARNQRIIFKKPRGRMVIEADPQYLRMILENLLSNASKYSYEGTKIRVDVSSSNGEVTVSVVDHGVGIPNEQLSELFQKFNRIPNDLSRQVSGSGIGLYLAKQLALLHNGDITCISKPNKGTTFTLTIPRRQAET
jgi:signal transduction histidine kinase